MIEIKLEEATSLTLEMHIEGDVKQDAPQLRFSVLSEGLRYSFNSSRTSAGVYQIDFPKMLGKITEGEYSAEVEIILDGKHFVPLQETVRFTKEVKPTVKLAETAVAPTAAPSIKIGSVKVAKPVREISDVRGLMVALNEHDEFDTSFALTALNKFALHESAMVGDTRIKPKTAMSEKEALVALRLIREAASTDLENTQDWSAIANISPEVRNELRSVLSEKGVSARTLKNIGF